MKNLLFFLVLFPFLILAQNDIPEPAIKNTEFRPSIFQSNYLTQNTLVRFLKQSLEMIDLASTSMQVTAKDLYYDKSSIYSVEEKINTYIRQEYFISEAQKIKKLDSALHIDQSWLNTIVKDDALDVLFAPLSYGYKFSVKGNNIYAVGPPPSGNSKQSLYLFEFNGEQRIVSQNLGRINSIRDTLYWMTTHYEYDNGTLLKEVYRKCNDYQCYRGYELKTTLYKDGLPKIQMNQYYSRHDGELYKEDFTDYYYTENVLKYSQTRFNVYNNGARELNSKSRTEFRFNSEGLMVFSKKLTWDKNEELIERYTEELRYEENAYIHTYKESLKKESGKEILPLQYELTFTFTSP